MFIIIINTSTNPMRQIPRISILYFIPQVISRRDHVPGYLVSQPRNVFSLHLFLVIILRISPFHAHCILYFIFYFFSFFGVPFKIFRQGETNKINRKWIEKLIRLIMKLKFSPNQSI